MLECQRDRTLMPLIVLECHLCAEFVLCTYASRQGQLTISSILHVNPHSRETAASRDAAWNPGTAP